MNMMGLYRIGGIGEIIHETDKIIPSSCLESPSELLGKRITDGHYTVLKKAEPEFSAESAMTTPEPKGEL